MNTSENPADYASRGLTVEQFLAKENWIKGPSFLKEASNRHKKMDKPECMRL